MKQERKVKCLKCKKEFITTYSQKKYCSEECKKNYYKDSYKEKIKIIHKKIKKCKYCKKDFLWLSSKSHQIYCSNKCRELWYEKYYSGEIESPEMKYQYYKIRFEIFKRDNFTCQYCGRNVKEDGIKLHCDHIFPKKKGGLFIVSNLITSCKECNLGKGDVLLTEYKLNKLKIKNDN